jgi:hypothetical protein
MSSLTMNFAPLSPSSGMRWDLRPRDSGFDRRLVAYSLTATAASMPPKWQEEVSRRLIQLLNLPQGWDGYSAEPISEAMAAFVTNVLNSTMSEGTPSPDIVPASGGGVQIEWHTGGVDIELFIPRPNEACLTVGYMDGREPFEGDLTTDFSILGEVLEPLAA